MLVLNQREDRFCVADRVESVREATLPVMHGSFSLRSGMFQLDVSSEAAGLEPLLQAPVSSRSSQGLVVGCTGGAGSCKGRDGVTFLNNTAPSIAERL